MNDEQEFLNSSAGLHNHRISSKIDAHKVAAKKFGVDEQIFAKAIECKDITALNNLGLIAEKLSNGSVSVSKDNVRYRSPTEKRTKEIQGNIEIKPSNIKWEDVDNRNPSSLRFGKDGNDTVANNHLTVEEEK